MKEFTLIRSIDDLPKPGETIYLIYIRYIDYKDGKQISMSSGQEELYYAFGFARYNGNGIWEQLDGENVGFVENLESYKFLPSAGYKPLEFSYPDDNGGSDIISKYDVIAYYELPKTPSAEEMMMVIPQTI